MTTTEACELLLEMTRECVLVRADRDVAIAERDASQLWLRASLRCNVELTRQNDRLREDNRRERQMHAALREAVLERQEAA